MGKRKILVAGCFDLLHPGHVKFLEWCKSRFKGELVVVLARNSNARMLKRRKLIFSEEERKILIRALKPVDRVILGDRKNFFRPLLKERPDIIVLGYDQWAKEREVRDFLRKNGIEAKVVRAPPFSPRKWKSSKIIEKILKTFNLNASK